MDEVYTTTDGSIAKYVHVNNSETSIKTWPDSMASCGGSTRKKFNVFASCSSGCPINCTFCYLTSKKFPFTAVDVKDTTSNIVTAVENELERRPELKRLPMNLSWMGMGDPFFNLLHTHMASISIIARLRRVVNSYEGVDISTTLPFISYDCLHILTDIDHALVNTNNVTRKDNNRTNVRLFYSLHSLNNKVRKTLIPKTIDLDVALTQLDKYQKQYNVIYHYMFLEGINDTDQDIDLLSKFGENHNIRILRFNKCPNTKYKESENFNAIIEKLNSRIDIKVQLSPGSEISAACGMFLMRFK